MLHVALRLTLNAIGFFIFISAACADCSFILNEKLELSGNSDSAEFVAFDPAYWLDNWKWTSPRYRERKTEAAQRLFQSTGTKLPFDVTVQSERDDRTLRLTWDYQFHEPAKLRAATSIKFRSIDDTFSASELRDDRTGFSFSVPGASGDVVNVRFTSPLAGLNYERGQKTEIRAYRYTPDRLARDQRITMDITLPESCRFALPVSARLDQPESRSWQKGVVTAQQSPPSMPFEDLNSDLKKRPRVEGEALVNERGKAQRYWGTNITAAALFKTPESEIKGQAERMKNLGFNLVRLHHHDSTWVNPNIFGDRKVRTSTRKLSKSSLKVIDTWIAALEAEGIAIWLDLHVGRRFRDNDDITFFEELKKEKSGGASGSGFLYINQSMQARWKEFASAYLGRVNSKTGVRYADNPAIIAVQLTNENDLSHHFGNALLPDKNVPGHNAIYMMLSRDFAGKYGLSPNRTWRSWEPGPSKLFLANLEHGFNREMTEHIRELGFDGLVSTTSSWGGMPLSGHLSLTDGDVIDVHSYDSPGFLSANPSAKANAAHWLAMGQVAGLPMTVTEWNISPFPAYDRPAMPMYMASMASFQGWDAMMQYAYTQNSTARLRPPNNWQMANDPAFVIMMPAAALAYRRGDVSEAKQIVTLTLPPSRFVNEKVSPDTSALLRSVPEKHGLRIAIPQQRTLPWLKAARPVAGSVIKTDPDENLLKGQTQVVSDTRELSRDWQRGIHKVDTPRTQYVGGWVGGEVLSTTAVDFAIDTPMAAIAVQSLTDMAIKYSDRLLISTAAQSLYDKSQKAMLMEPIKGALTIRSSQTLSAQSLALDGSEAPLNITSAGGQYTIDLSEAGAGWIVLEAR